MAGCCICGRTDFNPIYWYTGPNGDLGPYCGNCYLKAGLKIAERWTVPQAPLTGAAYGWTCPKCGNVHGPQVSQCCLCCNLRSVSCFDCYPTSGELMQPVTCLRCSHPTSTLVSDPRGASGGQVRRCYARLTPDGKWEKGCAYQEVDPTTRALLDKLFDW
jgi:hypothetical protein